MPTVKRSTRQRTAMLAGELADDPDSVDVGEPEPPAYEPEPPGTAPLPQEPPVAVPSDPVPSAPPSPENSLIAQLVAALAASSQTQAQAIKEALADSATMAREQIPENKVSPGHSVYSHPEGDQKHPRTVLRCPMFLGVYNDEGKVSPAFEYFPETLTEEERLAFNALTPGVRRDLRRHDGLKALVRVAEQQDSTGQAMRLIVGVPEAWLGKDQFQQMPSCVDMLIQLLTAQGLTADERDALKVA